MIDLSKRNVILAGAGPGDPELISVKAFKAITVADVILYDALVNKELLLHAPPHCKLVYVGKRKGKKEFSQDEINGLLLFYAQRYGYVLRLKGGDPYVFGRGHEELQYLQHNGIHVEVIPGITSAVAAPASVGIPLTKRGINESFWVITGMLSTGEFSRDLILASKSNATVIILMGMTHMKEILQVFGKNRSPLEPVAVIQNACSESEKYVIGHVTNIVSLVRENAITSPAVIVVGKVVSERNIHQMILKGEVKMKVAV